LEEMGEQKKAEIRLISDLTYEATMAVDAKVSKLIERPTGKSSAK
jgi:hypothetical protein